MKAEFTNTEKQTNSSEIEYPILMYKNYFGKEITALFISAYSGIVLKSSDPMMPVGQVFECGTLSKWDWTPSKGRVEITIKNK